MAKKLGRKQKHHIDSKTGKPVDGLTRRPDGRWRIIGTHKTFREEDEQKAIQRFKELTGDSPARKAYKEYALEDLLPQLPNLLALPEAWRVIGDIIRARPTWTAEHSGVKELAYLHDLKPLERLPSFDALETLWKDKATCDKEEKRKVLADWHFFIEQTSTVDLRGIKVETVVDYRNKVYALGLSGKRQGHLFNRARRMLTFAQEQAVAIEACEKALVAMRLLVPNESTVSLNPEPIAPADFQKLLGKATGDNKAMLLLMLNAALHMKECIDLKWDDIQGQYLSSDGTKSTADWPKDDLGV